MSKRNDRRKRKKADAARARKGEKAHVPLAPPPYRGHVPLESIDGTRWRVPKTNGMHVDGIVYADEVLLPSLKDDRSLEQVANVATLPGIVGHSLAMPDIHWGYGFPIGGVAAFDPDHGGVVSPGGVGYDINCGVRLLASDLGLGDVKAKIEPLTRALFEAIPAGVGSKRAELRLSTRDLEELMVEGLPWAVRKGFATPHDVQHVEESGRIDGADPEKVSARAKQRGLPQLGTLGSGNHFAEVGVVEEIFAPDHAEAFGLREGQVTLMIHSGSRGLGHQVCTDSLSTMIRAAGRYGIPLVDRQLCCAPIRSREAEDYLGAMAAAANFAFCNRQIMAHWARDVFDRLFGASLTTVYDVCHNIAKFEKHALEGRGRRVLVHRKGATRALPKGHPLLPNAYRESGQPVVIPGDMGRYSFVLAGAAGSRETFGSACHGAGRLLSRSAAKRQFGGTDVQRKLRDQGVIVLGASRATIVEEMPFAYKDVAEVVEVVHAGRLADKVARIRPLGCVKG
ncbi:MAG TPA: RtcB family protein [Sandaracinaceae bacterium LLY-WYZ-13_1]|nr:RtcB family protein [Sandaracinaceae bacterium LLY-WYZ-13_1]